MSKESFFALLAGASVYAPDFIGGADRSRATAGTLVNPMPTKRRQPAAPVRVALPDALRRMGGGFNRVPVLHARIKLLYRQKSSYGDPASCRRHKTLSKCRARSHVPANPRVLPFDRNSKGQLRRDMTSERVGTIVVARREIPRPGPGQRHGVALRAIVFVPSRILPCRASACFPRREMAGMAPHRKMLQRLPICRAIWTRPGEPARAWRISGSSL